MAGPGRDPVQSSAGRPERTLRSVRLHRPSRHQSRRDPAWSDPGRGDMVIGAFVLARLLGLRLLTLEAQVVVHDDARPAAGSGALIMTEVAPDRPALSPARTEHPVPPRGLGLPSGRSDPLARAVQLVEQGADTLERTRRAQHRG